MNNTGYFIESQDELNQDLKREGGLEVLESSEAEVRFMTIFIYSAHLHLGTSQSVSLGLKFQDPGEEKLILLA